MPVPVDLAAGRSGADAARPRRRRPSRRSPCRPALAGGLTACAAAPSRRGRAGSATYAGGRGRHRGRRRGRRARSGRGGLDRPARGARRHRRLRRAVRPRHRPLPRTRCSCPPPTGWAPSCCVARGHRPLRHRRHRPGGHVRRRPRLRRGRAAVPPRLRRGRPARPRADRGSWSPGWPRAAGRPAAPCSAARWPSTPGPWPPATSTWPASPWAWSSAAAMLGPDRVRAGRRPGRPGLAGPALQRLHPGPPRPARAGRAGPRRPGLGRAPHSLADELLRPSVIYAPAVLARWRRRRRRCTPRAHITGGGIPGNLARVAARRLRRRGRPRRAGTVPRDLRRDRAGSATWTTTRWPGCSTWASAWCWSVDAGSADAVRRPRSARRPGAGGRRRRGGAARGPGTVSVSAATPRCRRARASTLCASTCSPTRCAAGDFVLKSGRRSSAGSSTPSRRCAGPRPCCWWPTPCSRVIPDDATAIGGLTMGADPVAFVTAGVAATRGRALQGLQRPQGGQGPRRRRPDRRRPRPGRQGGGHRGHRHPGHLAARGGPRRARGRGRAGAAGGRGRPRGHRRRPWPPARASAFRALLERARTSASTTRAA